MQRIIRLQFQDILPLDAENSFVKRRVEGRSSLLDTYVGAHPILYAEREISPITWPAKRSQVHQMVTTPLVYCANSFAKKSNLELQECTIDLKQGLKRDWV